MASITKTKTAKGEIRYRVRALVGYRPNGDPIQTMRTFRTRKEGEAWCRAMETDRDRGQVVATSKGRLAAYLEDWLASAARRVRPSTLVGYRYIVEHTIVPGLGHHPLRDLSPALAQRWLDGLSPDTAIRSRKVLHTALEEAVRLELLPANPLRRVTAPPRPPSRASSWSTDEARAFLTVAARQEYHPYWLLAVRCGLRPSELLGLRWSSLELDAATLTVSEARAIVGKKLFAAEAPKSRSGHRTLDLPADVVSALRAHKVAQNEARLKSVAWDDQGLVCASRRGTPLDPRSLGRAFARLCAQAGVRPIRLYDLRHTAITLMATAGADIKAISEVAGHANVRITRDVYQHVNRSQRKAALVALGTALEEPKAAIS